MKRVMRDMQAFSAPNRSPDEQRVQAKFERPDDWTNVLMMIETPQDRVYCGQKHVLRATLRYVGYDGKQYAYPHDPPRVVFLTHMFHPNVGEFNDSNQGAAICLDILKGQWGPLSSLASLGQSILLLLDAPNPASPLNPTAGRLWSQCERKFAATGHDECRRRECFMPYEQAARAYAAQSRYMTDREFQS